MSRARRLTWPLLLAVSACSHDWDRFRDAGLNEGYWTSPDLVGMPDGGSPQTLTGPVRASMYTRSDVPGYRCVLEDLVLDQGSIVVDCDPTLVRRVHVRSNDIYTVRSAASERFRVERSTLECVNPGNDGVHGADVELAGTIVRNCNIGLLVDHTGDVQDSWIVATTGVKADGAASLSVTHSFVDTPTPSGTSTAEGAIYWTTSSPGTLTARDDLLAGGHFTLSVYAPIEVHATGNFFVSGTAQYDYYSVPTTPAEWQDNHSVTDDDGRLTLGPLLPYGQ